MRSRRAQRNRRRWSAASRGLLTTPKVYMILLFGIGPAAVVESLPLKRLQRLRRNNAPVSAGLDRDGSPLGVIRDDEVPDVLEGSPYDPGAGKHRVSGGAGGAVIIYRDAQLLVGR